jgi:hypothetical protein
MNLTQQGIVLHLGIAFKILLVIFHFNHLIATIFHLIPLCFDHHFLQQKSVTLIHLALLL